MADTLSETREPYLVDAPQSPPTPRLPAHKDPSTWFQPGNRLNPGGRSPGLSRLARELTKNGEEIVHFYLRVLRGQRLPRLSEDGSHKLAPLKGRGDIPSLKHRMQAAEWLADRGWGKVVQTTELRSDQPVTLIQLRWGDERQEAIDVAQVAAPEADGLAETPSGSSELPASE